MRQVMLKYMFVQDVVDESRIHQHEAEQSRFDDKKVTHVKRTRKVV